MEFLKGPILFILYTRDLIYIAAKHKLKIHVYADDTQLYIGFRPDIEGTSVEQRIEDCLKDIETWMKNNYLKLNTNKTNMIYLGSKKNLQAFTNLVISQANEVIQPSETVKSLGILIDPTLSMVAEINQRCSSAYFHIRNIGRIKNCLDVASRILLVQNLVLSKLDYCNACFANVPAYQITKLQRVMNAAVRMIYNLRKREHVTPYLNKAHFLPVKFRIKFKLCLLVYKALNRIAPDYMTEMLTEHTPTLRDGRDIKMLEFPPNKEKTIYYQMCSDWNALPLNIRNLDYLPNFKNKLKTYYFNEAFNQNNSDTDSESDF